MADWICLLESTNAVLIGTTDHLSPEMICSHIETHLHVDTLVASRLAEVHLIKLYADFCKAIKLVDDMHIRNTLLLQQAVVHMLPTNTSNTTHCEHPTRNYTVTAVPMTTANIARLPPLTEAERALLVEYAGCFKCCRFFTPHVSCDCDRGFPGAVGYKTLTEVDAKVAKRLQGGKQAKVAAVLPSGTMNVFQPVAIVPAVVVMPSAVLGDGSQSECVEAPFFTPHLFVDVIISGSSCSSEAPAHALIHHGCDSVLISPEFTDCIGLTRCKLPEPKTVIMAVGGDKKEEFVFKEYEKLSVFSSDQVWSSWSCKAIIALNLCVPIILGGPFLSFNQFVIDHDLRTCIDKKFGYDLLNPPPHQMNYHKTLPYIQFRTQETTEVHYSRY